MRKINLLGSLAIVLLGPTLLSAQASRTWVSGVGDDANPCSRTAPCKTWAGAISKTAAGGEIDALDPGGFGAVTITKAITLDGGGGQVASTLVTGTNAIVVAAGANDVVIIRNIRLDGLLGSGNAGLNGISFLSGKDLDVENCVIFGFGTNGINISVGASATVHIINTIVKNSGSCVPGSCTNSGDGVFAATSAGTLKVAIDNSQIMLASNNGVEASGSTKVTINRSLISAAGANDVIANSGSLVGLDYVDVVNGAGNGVTANGGGSAVVVSHSTIAGNGGTAYNPTGGGQVFAFSYQNNGVSTSGTNRVHDNGVLGTAVYISEN